MIVMEAGSRPPLSQPSTNALPILPQPTSKIRPAVTVCLQPEQDLCCVKARMVTSCEHVAGGDVAFSGELATHQGGRLHADAPKT